MVDAVPDTDLPIVDAHHHLYAKNHYGDGKPYLLSEFSTEIRESGQNVIATIYVECGNFLKTTGPEYLRTTGEVAFAADMGRLAETGAFGTARICEAIVGHADLLADTLDQSLEVLIEAGEGRLRGIRFATTWDADAGLSPGARPFGPPGLTEMPKFRSGLAKLADAGLAYDAWQFYPQLAELGALAAAVPDANVVCGHCGGLVGLNAYAGPDNFNNWRAAVVALAEHPNVVMKLGGLANDRTGFGFRSRAERPSEEELVTAWGPYVETCIEAFGADRCMFESNFPVDGIAADYRTLWSVYKRIASGCSLDEKAMLFAGTARRIYQLD